LEIPAEVWELVTKHPETAALLIENADQMPREITGTQLLTWQQSGRVRLYPAYYRIREELPSDEDRTEDPAVVDPSASAELRSEAAANTESDNGKAKLLSYEADEFRAKGFPFDGGFVIMNGSSAALKTSSFAANSVKELRDKLIRQGRLADMHEFLLFTQDVYFENSTQAAMVVCGGDPNRAPKWTPISKVK